MEEYENENRKKKKGGFGLNLIKCVIFAVVFGLIAGGIVFAINNGPEKSTGESSSILRQADDSAQPEQSLKSDSRNRCGICQRCFRSRGRSDAIDRIDHYDRHDRVL